ncbi:MAG: DUF6029 family protein [Bacteroidota bacterium]|nr:DUF6029 family protein [Bacteroidota bacterium]
MKKIVFCITASFLFFSVKAQETGQLNGELMTNVSVYDYDSLIGTNTTQYLHELSSAEAWLFLTYRQQGFTVSVRYDMFQNSPLLNPQEAYTKQGIGFYSVTKELEDWEFTAGYFYDQIGSGIIYRAYEERLLGLDYATMGLRVKYSPNDSFMIKAFTGQQKFRFDLHPQVMQGVNVERLWGIGSKITMFSGIGMIKRTLDNNTMNELASRINSFPYEERFIPLQNVFAGTIYNQANFGPFSLYLEYARKTKEAILAEQPDKTYELANKGGDVFYGSLGFSRSGFGINVQYKKINSFILRESPFHQLLVGSINFLPPLARQNTFRLPARYATFARDQGEDGFQGDITFSPTKKTTFTLNGTLIFRPNGQQLYKEVYFDYLKKFNKNTRGLVGIQSIYYDIETYQGKVQAPVVTTITPFTEWSFRLDKTRRKSLRFEAQYLFTHQDKGDLAFALVEFNWAPHLSLSISDMVNTRPKAGEQMIHYYTLFSAYTYKQTRLTAGYIKQLEGVVCTGGVCRAEPAFSGFRFGINTNF